MDITGTWISWCQKLLYIYIERELGHAEKGEITLGKGNKKFSLRTEVALELSEE